jgi:O-antigen ligase
VKTSIRPNIVFEQTIIVHVVVFAIFASWALGGNVWWAKLPMCVWGSIGILLAIAYVIQHRSSWPVLVGNIYLFIPLVAFNILAIISTLNPNHREIILGGQNYLMKVSSITWLPSSARPHDTWLALWLFDGVYLSCFNLFVIIKRRRSLRTLIIVLAINAIVLSVIGSLQKFVGAKGPFFGMIPSPNSMFFSTFLYHNHWGPFIILLVAGCLGYTWHYLQRGAHEYRDFWHSPAFLVLVGIVILSATIPLSGSRSCTVLIILLLCAGLLHWGTRTINKNLAQRESIIPTMVGGGSVVILSIAAIVWSASPIIMQRFDQTTKQIDYLIQHGTFDDRFVVYRDVLAMTKDQPWFGWGMASFPYVFNEYNSQIHMIDNRYSKFYVDAHSDWLQSLSEHGIVGSLLLCMSGIFPILKACHRFCRGFFSRYLLFGCGLVLVQALYEFPFGNPAVVLVWWICYFSALRYPELDM